MRLVTWNCNGALRRKYHALDALCADILVVQECEDPEQSLDTVYLKWAGDYQWTGLNKNRGIGVFARAGYALKRAAMPPTSLELFLPVVINERWPLLAVWTRQAKSPTFGYIGQLWKFLQIRGHFIQHPGALLAGDFNSNACWDIWDRWWNHSDVVRWLGENRIYSAWHSFMDEKQGQETVPTFCMYRNAHKPYHIDYVFTEACWKIENVEIGSHTKWLLSSDHMPVVVDMAYIDGE